MTATSPAQVHSVSFAALDGGVWGAALDSGTRFVTLGSPAGAGSVVGRESVSWTEENDLWRLAGDGFELLITPADASAERGSGADTDGHELCHVQGSYTLGGAEYAVDCAGARATRDRGDDLRSLDSVRVISALFEDDYGLTLLSCRPQGATGHEHDLVTGAVCEKGSCLPVSDPRLSTTYTSEGLPARVSLEFWLGEGEEQYLRRAAGESVAPAAALESPDLEARAAGVRWHSRGLAGRGVYLLARSR
jgi:hypothetical protein